MQFQNGHFATASGLLALTALFWAGNAVLARGMHADFPPMALAWARWTLATLIILPFAWRRLRADWPVIRRDWPMLVFLGAIGAGSFNTLAYIGLNHTAAINAVVLNSSGPVLIALMVFLLDGERPSGRQALGIAVSLAGVLAVIARGEPAALATLTLGRGDLWMLAAMVCWALYTVMLRRRPAIHGLSFAAATFAVAALANSPFFLVEHIAHRSLVPSVEAGLTVVYLALFPSVFAYLFFNRGVELIGATAAGIFLHLIPLFGSALAILLLGEALYPYHVAGFALILAGIALASRGR